MAEKIYAQPAGYELVEFLGEGLNSCVYRAIKEDQKSGVRFELALKILKSEKLVELWRAEVDRLSTVKSKNCVSLLGWEYICNKPALVLEYVRGATLAELCETSRLTPVLLMEILTQAYAGLCDLNIARVFHGDLNLHNIMIDDSGWVKLLDFGVIRSDEKVMTTPEFASPEVMSGAPPTFQSDLYSLRAIGIEICRRQHIEANLKFEKSRSLEVRRSELANLVSRHLEYRKQASGRTRNMIQIKRVEWTWSRLIRMATISVLLLSSLVSFGDQAHQFAKTDRLSVHLSVRSKKWLHIVVDGVDLGYTPIETWLDPKSKVELEWTSRDHSGRTTLTLVAGQHIVLTEGDFISLKNTP